MADEKKGFNLVDEPWIRVRDLEGVPAELSLRAVFECAPRLQSLANDLPTQDFAILRLLEAVLQRAVVDSLEGDEDPSDVWGALWRTGELPMAAVNAYLDVWKSRFDLLDEDQPFMQVAGLTATNGTVSEVGKFLADYPDGLPLFTMRSGGGIASLSYAEAARWLVHVHAFDTSGIKTGVVGDPAVKGGKSYPIGTGWSGGLGGIYLEGTTLAHTLLLNLCLCYDCKDATDALVDVVNDVPVWERPSLRAGDECRKPTGYADIYTWQSRRVLLQAHDGRIDGLILSNGSKLDYHNRRAIEPMTAWRRSLPQEKKLKISPVYLPFTHQSGRSFWRGLTAILPEATLKNDDAFIAPGVVLWAGFLASINGGRKLSKTYPVRMHAAGFVYGVQSAVVTDMIDDTLSFNAFLLSPEGADSVALAKQCMSDTDEAVRALGFLAVNLKLASGLDPELVGGAREEAKAEAYYELDELFRMWLTRLSKQTDKPLLWHEDAWHAQAQDVLRKLGRQLMEGADDKALRGRKVKQRGREEWVSAGRAESMFLYQLNKALPIRTTEDQASQKEGRNGV